MTTFCGAFRLLIAAIGAAAGALVPAGRADPTSAPSGLAVHFSDSTATITWDEVAGSRGYGVTIRPLGVQGPYGEEQVRANRYSLPLAQFPGYGRYKKGYAYRVCSFSTRGEGPCTTLADGFYVDVAGNGVSTSDRHGAARNRR